MTYKTAHRLHLGTSLVANIGFVFFNIFYFIAAKHYYLESTSIVFSSIWLTVRLLQVAIFFFSFFVFHAPIKKLYDYKQKIKEKELHKEEVEKIAQQILEEQKTNTHQGFENAINITDRVRK